MTGFSKGVSLQQGVDWWCGALVVSSGVRGLSAARGHGDASAPIWPAHPRPGLAPPCRCQRPQHLPM
jgi:hypothetical protein